MAAGRTNTFASRSICDPSVEGQSQLLVWTERTSDAERLIREDDFVFEAELEQRFGHRLGALHVEGPRRAFPSA